MNRWCLISQVKVKQLMRLIPKKDRLFCFMWNKDATELHLAGVINHYR